jgi:predicted TPR repeat methyltransferase
MVRAAAPAPGSASGSPVAALQQGVNLLRAERLAEAEAAFQAVLARWPEQPDALHFLGLVRHAQRRSDDGVALIRRALALAPTEPGPWNNLGNVLVECLRLDEAAEAYRTSIAVAKGQPASAEALNNLGTVHRKRLAWAEAERCYREALALRPDFVDAWYNLSLALIGQGRVAEGLQANSRAIVLSPRHLQPRDQVVRALLLLGERERAAALYREWLAEDPANPVVQHQLAACLGDAAPERASDAYVERVFDSFARSFDAKLEALHYRAPQRVADALQRAVGAPGGTLDICDAGCGTGLCGPLLRPFARTLSGCDLSAGMLKQAQARGGYDTLHKAELVQHLDAQPGRFDAVVSADTLCYFGDLHAATAAAWRALRPGGWLVYTVEALAAQDTDAPFVLQTSGRYAHQQAHVQASLAAAGFDSVAVEAVELRLEAGRPVNGWLVSARRGAASA